MGRYCIKGRVDPVENGRFQASASAWRWEPDYRLRMSEERRCTARSLDQARERLYGMVADLSRGIVDRGDVIEDVEIVNPWLMAGEKDGLPA